jgi:hypothetical protein
MSNLPSPPHRFRRLLVPVAAALALSACVGATPYQPLGTRGSSGGFAEQRIEANRYRVTFVGNDYTSRARVENYLLFRAAELTVANGYDGFSIVRHDTDRNVEQRVYDTGLRSPYYGYGGLYGGWRPSWRYYGGRYGWRSWDPWYGGPYWGDSFDVRTVERYEATAEIVMFRGTRADPSSFNARQVITNLRPTIVVPR